MKVLVGEVLALALAASLVSSVCCAREVEPERAEASARQEAPALSGRQEASGNQTIPAAAALKEITVSFKLDPRLTRGMYMGDRWVSPPVFTSTLQEGKELTVEARGLGYDAKGRPVAINPQWIPADPGMLSVLPAQGREVKIIVRRAGESKLKVVAAGYFKELLVKATQKGSAIQVEIAQGQVKH